MTNHIPYGSVGLRGRLAKHRSEPPAKKGISRLRIVNFLPKFYPKRRIEFPKKIDISRLKIIDFWIKSKIRLFFDVLRPEIIDLVPPFSSSTRTAGRPDGRPLMPTKRSVLLFFPSKQISQNTIKIVGFDKNSHFG